MNFIGLAFFLSIIRSHQHLHSLSLSLSLSLNPNSLLQVQSLERMKPWPHPNANQLLEPNQNPGAITVAVKSQICMEVGYMDYVPQGAASGKGYDKVCNNCHLLVSMHDDGYCQIPLRIYQGIMNKLILLGLGLGILLSN